MDNKKYEACVTLRTLVAELDMARAVSVVETFKDVVGLYPEGWEPYKEGIRWHGFYIRHATMYGFGIGDAELTVTCQSKRKHRTWYGLSYEVTERYGRGIEGPRDMLYVLENLEPADG